jgi:hypothetical protein
MRRRARGALGVLLVCVIVAAVSAPASAQTSGDETFDIVLVTSGLSGTRTVVSSVVLARGAFTGVGRIVEIPNLPGDPDNVLRDDLVFSGGSIHLVSEVVDVAFSINPRSCIATITIQQIGTVVGGTGRFATAQGSFTGTLNGRALARRNPDGSCSQEQAALVEVVKITESGSLSF